MYGPVCMDAHINKYAQPHTYKCASTSAGIGLTGHSISLWMLSGARALLTALCLLMHTKGGKLRYKYSSARPHGHFSVGVPRELFMYICTYEGVPDLCVEDIINGPTDGP